jgi:serine/threonine-protein kinase RsbW
VDTTAARGGGPGVPATPARLQDTVVLSLPASSAYLSVLRTATAALAARLQFTLDEIEDLRIAVDEACAMLLDGDELPDAELRCRFALTGDEIAITVTLPHVRRASPARDTYAWQVLTALAGEVDATVANGELTLALTKRRRRTS